MWKREKRLFPHSLELCQIVGELTLAQLNDASATNLSPILFSPPSSPPPPIISATRARHDSLETLFETLDLPSSPPPPPRIIKRNKKRVFFFHQNRYANIIPRGIIVFLSFPERGGGEASKDNLNIDIG